MNVRELIDILEELPPEATVTCDGQDGGIVRVELLGWTTTEPVVEIVAGGDIR